MTLTIKTGYECLSDSEMLAQEEEVDGIYIETWVHKCYETYVTIPPNKLKEIAKYFAFYSLIWEEYVGKWMTLASDLQLSIPLYGKTTDSNCGKPTENTLSIPLYGKDLRKR